jgi:hypothetical protein
MKSEVKAKISITVRLVSAGNRQSHLKTSDSVQENHKKSIIKGVEKRAKPNRRYMVGQKTRYRLVDIMSWTDCR